MALQAVVFDFDGLLMDSESAEFAGYSEVFSRHGVTLDLMEWGKCVGTGPGVWKVEEHLAELLGAPVDAHALHTEAKAIRDEILRTIEPLPGGVALVESLSQSELKIAVASSSRSVWIEHFLRHVGLRHHFEVVRTRDMVGAAKPAPDLYLAACEALGVDPHRSIALEDSPNGMKAAKAAGMLCLGIPNAVTAGYDLSPADWVIDSLTQVEPEWLIDWAPREYSADPSLRFEKAAWAMRLESERRNVTLREHREWTKNALTLKGPEHLCEPWINQAQIRAAWPALP